MDLRSLEITPEFLRLIAEVDEFKGSWKIIHSLSPDRLQSLKRVATIESIGSSTRIEGAKLSDKQVQNLLQSVSRQSFVSRDEEEVAGYADLMDMINESYTDIAVTENYIKQMHGVLLRPVAKDSGHRGDYKKFPNHVEAFDEAGVSLGVVFETTSPFDTPQKMEGLVRWVRETLEDKSHHPLIVVAVFTVAFLGVHPFQDGNGRLSRALTSLLLLKAGYAYIPYSSMESIIERNKEAYYLALRKTQISLSTENIDWSPWLRFFLTALKRQKDHLAVKLEGMNANNFKNLLPEETLILEHASKYGRITTSEAHTLTNLPRPTVKLRLSQLAGKNMLEMKGKGRGAYYQRPKGA